MKREVKEKDLFRIIDERLEENDKHGINSIIVLTPEGITVIGLDPVNGTFLRVTRKQ